MGQFYFGAGGQYYFGANTKATVRDNEQVLWLAKFPSRRDALIVPVVEAATLQLAAARSVWGSSAASRLWHAMRWNHRTSPMQTWRTQFDAAVIHV